MIVKEFFKIREDGVLLFRTYSDRDLCILQRETGVVYDEAIDIDGAPYTYEETDIKIGENEDDRFNQGNN